MNGIDKNLSKKFCEFLEKAGAEILAPTNPWELARFKTANGVCVVYQNKRGQTTYSNTHAHDAYAAYRDGRAWVAVDVKERIKRKTVEELLIERDGENCFYCDVLFDTETRPTLEHLLSIQHGGNNHQANLVLACKSCNYDAGNLPIVEKIKLRDARRRR